MVTRKDEIAEQTRLRQGMLAMGYTPLANIDKRCVLEGWGQMPVDASVVAEWSGMLKYRATGLRMEPGLVAIDFDIDDAAALDAIEDRVQAEPGTLWYRLFDQAPLRYGKGNKVMYLMRLAPGEQPFVRIASAAFARPGEDPEAEGVSTHRLEVFGGKGGRQFGVYGAHTIGPDGQVAVHYRWHGGMGPDNTPKGALPVVTEAEMLWLGQVVSEVLEARGWVYHQRSKAGRTDEAVVYDLTDEMVFVVHGGDVLSLAQLEAALVPGQQLRLSASWLEGPSAANTTRCLASLHPRDGRLSILETAAWTMHRPRDLAPRPIGEGIAERLERLAAAGSSFFTGGGAGGGSVAGAGDGAVGAALDAVGDRGGEGARDGLEMGLEHLLEHYAFCPSEQRPVLPLDNPEAGAMTLGNFRALMKPFAIVTVGPRGGVTETNPVDLWMADERRLTVEGVRFVPVTADRIVSVGGRDYVNLFMGLPGAGEGVAAAADAAAEQEALGVFSRFMAHLFPDVRERAWVTMWLAAGVQRPWQPRCGVIMHTPVQGTGRSTLFDLLRNVMGKRHVRQVNAATLLGGSGQAAYTDWLADALLVTCDEVLAGDDAGGSMSWKRREAYERLKALVDPRGREMLIVRKGLQNYMAEVYASYMLATNNANALPVSVEDRRWAVLANTRLKLRAAEGGALMADMEPYRALGGGFGEVMAGAVRRYLARADVDWEAVRDAPEWLEGRGDMIEANKSDLEETLEALLAGLTGDFISNAALRQKLQVRLTAEGLIDHVKNWWVRAQDVLAQPNGTGWERLPRRPKVGAAGGKQTVYARAAGLGAAYFEGLTWVERAAVLDETAGGIAGRVVSFIPRQDEKDA